MSDWDPKWGIRPEPVMTHKRMWFLIGRDMELAKPCPAWIHRFLDGFDRPPTPAELRRWK